MTIQAKVKLSSDIDETSEDIEEIKEEIKKEPTLIELLNDQKKSGSVLENYAQVLPHKPITAANAKK